MSKRLNSSMTLKARKAIWDKISGDLRLKIVFNEHIAEAKYALANASILMEIHKDDFTVEDRTSINQALLVVHELALKHSDIGKNLCEAELGE